MQAIKHPFEKQIICSSMLCLHVLSAGSCQFRNMVPQPNKAGIEGQQINALTHTQKQAVTPQNQAQTQHAQEIARILAEGAETQTQHAQETARILAQNQDTLTQLMCILTTNNNRGAACLSGAETLRPITKGTPPQLIGQKEQPSVSLASAELMPPASNKNTDSSSEGSPLQRQTNKQKSKKKLLLKLSPEMQSLRQHIAMDRLLQNFQCKTNNFKQLLLLIGQSLQDLQSEAVNLEVLLDLVKKTETKDTSNKNDW